jgi:hypothetical protein
MMRNAMASESPEFLRRLVEGDDHQADLIRRALAEPPMGPSEQRSWQRLQARSQRRPTGLVLPALAAALALSAFAAWLHRPRADLSLSPEILVHRATAPQAAVAGPAVALPGTAGLATSERPRSTPRPSTSPSASAATELDTAPCAKLAQSAEYAAATSCYGRVARGGTMTSELALYEKARLEARALGNGTLALTTLDEHRRRFPGGVLTSEVAFTRIDLLMRLGKRVEALAAIDEGLHGALGRERGADLHLMRAGLLATNGDCTLALQAASAAREAGVHPSRLEAVERRCAENAPTSPTPKAP